MIVSPPLICRDQKFRGFASVGLLDSTRLGLHSFLTRSVATPVLLSAPIVEGYSTMILSSSPPSLSTPIRCLSLCSTCIALQLATAIPPATLPHRYRFLKPLLLLLNPLSLLVATALYLLCHLLCHLLPVYFPSCQTTAASHTSLHPRRPG
jgi:hypothetical protein